MTDDPAEVNEQPADETSSMVCVVFSGQMGDCIDMQTMLHEAGIEASILAASAVRNGPRCNGHYVVGVDPGLQPQARELIEADFRAKFNIETPDATSDQLQCPACGALHGVDAAECPECGLTFV